MQIVFGLVPCPGKLLITERMHSTSSVNVKLAGNWDPIDRDEEPAFGSLPSSFDNSMVNFVCFVSKVQVSFENGGSSALTREESNARTKQAKRMLFIGLAKNK